MPGLVERQHIAGNARRGQYECTNECDQDHGANHAPPP
jgi:hypothetical protein